MEGSEAEYDRFLPEAKKLAKPTPFRADASTVGTALLKVLKPAKKEKSPELADAQDARDRLWTLLAERHLELRRLGMFVWADDVDAHVPTLQAHRGGARKKKAAATDAPAAPTNGATTTAPSA